MSTTPQDPRTTTDAAGATDATEPVDSQDADATAEAPSDEIDAARPEGDQVNTDDDLRTAKIFELRNKIASGDYEIDAETIAKRIVDDI